MGANKPIEDIEASLLATTKSALDELVWWAHATMAAARRRKEPQLVVEPNINPDTSEISPT
jgi:hypothetical protein